MAHLGTTISHVIELTSAGYLYNYIHIYTIMNGWIGWIDKWFVKLIEGMIDH